LWVSAGTVPAEAGYQSPAVIAVQDGGQWRLIDYGTGIDDPNPHVPADVRDQL
jgi:hypothetical protein